MHLTRFTRQMTIGALACATALALAGTAHAQKKTTLNVASPLPVNHVVNKSIEGWLDNVAKASDGTLEFKWYPGEVVAKNRQSMDAVKNGLADASYVIDAYLPSELPHQITASRVGVYGADSFVMTGVANEYMLLNCAQCVQDWRKNGVIAMVHAATTAYHLACREALDSEEKLSGRRIRGAGSHGLFITEFGGVPVNIPITDTYEALQRGQVDCTMAVDAHMKSYSFNEVTRFMINAPYGVYMSGTPFMINASRWSSLPPETKKLIQSKLPDLAAEIAARYEEEAIAARKESEAKGVKWLEPSASLMAARQRYLDRVVQTAVEEGKKRRITGVEEMLAKFQPIYEKWEKIVAETGHDRAKFRDALEREVFSKITY